MLHHLLKLDLGNVCLPTDREHYGKCAIFETRLPETLADEVHVCVRFFSEAHTEQDVDREARVTNPRVTVVPVSIAASALLMQSFTREKRHSPNSTYIFRYRERRSSNDSTRRLIRQQLQNHQAPTNHLSPCPLVLALTDPVEPIVLCAMLLLIQHRSGNVPRDMIRDIISKHETHGLTFEEMNVCDDTFAFHSILHDLFETDVRTRSVVFAFVDRNIELQFEAVRAAESGSLRLRLAGGVVFDEELGDVSCTSVVESGKDLDVDVHFATDAFYTSDKPLLKLVLYDGGFSVGHLLGDYLSNDVGALRTGEEVNDIADALVTDVASLEDVGRRKVLLLSRPMEVGGRRNGEVTALFGV